MATQAKDTDLNLREQIARIDQMRANSDKFYAETQKMLRETKAVPLTAVFQGAIAFAAILGAGAAIAKFFLP